jgi:hypothetical protein
MKDIISSNSRLRKNIELIDELNCNCNSDNIHKSNELPPQYNSLFFPPITCFILFCLLMPIYFYCGVIYSLTNGNLKPPIAYYYVNIISVIMGILNCV